MLYSAPKKEITALAVDSAGKHLRCRRRRKARRRSASRTLPPSAGDRNRDAGSVRCQVAESRFRLGPPGAGPAPAVTVRLRASPVLADRRFIACRPDGSPDTLWSSRDDLVYALAFDSAGRLLAGSGNRGRIFAITGRPSTPIWRRPVPARSPRSRPNPKGGLYVADQQRGQEFSARSEHGDRRHLRERCLRRQEFLPVGTRRSSRHRQLPDLCPQRQRRQPRPQLERVEAGRSCRTTRPSMRRRALHSVEGGAASRRPDAGPRQRDRQLSAQERRAGSGRT